MAIKSSPQRKAKSQVPWERRAAIAFAFAVGVAALIVAAMTIARVRIVIHAEPERIVADFEVTVVGSGPATGREVLGRLVRADGSATIEEQVGGTMSAEDLPPQRARGTVTIVNERSDPQTLVATTRLLSSEQVLFRLEDQVVIPSGGTLEGVDVYADKIGSVGNIGPTRFTIPGLSTWLQERVYAESEAAMAGGQGSSDEKEVTLPAVVAADLDRVRDLAREQASREAENRIQAMMEKGEEIIATDGDVRVDVLGSVGEVRPTVQANALVTTTAILVPAGAVRERAEDELSKGAQSRSLVFLRVNDEATITRLVTHDPDANRATLAVHAEGFAAIEDNAHYFGADRIIGFTSEEVSTYMKMIPGVEDVEVSFFPFWINRVPSNSGSVSVEVQGPVQ